MKIRTLRQILRRRGYEKRPGRGSHSVWTHPRAPDKPIVLCGSANDDAHPYLVARVLISHKRRRH
ncbi:MAG: type II toxin-antitoxin system HicA family toxin [Chloroflexi bacterium]|nr:MAG: type II toxin-antitoxin system HicA family toxin [Chloroflexota bacterium]